MKVAIDISPLESSHQFRGIGFYTKNLLEEFKKSNKEDFFFELVSSNEEKRISKDSDLIHYPFFDFFFTTLPFKKEKPTVVSIHDCTPLVFPRQYPPGLKGQFKFLIQKISLKNVGKVITDSQNSKNDIIKYLGVPREKISVIYLAAGNKVKKISDQRFLNQIRKKFRLPEKFVLYVGDVNYNKNLPGLLSACREVGIALVLVGKQAVAKNFDRRNIENQSLIELEKMIAGKNDVKKVGFVKENDLAGLYSLAAVYCQPSFYEGFGLPILEAFSCGCPVVTSNVSSLPEIAGEAAILVNPEKTREIASGIRKVIEDKKIKDTMVEAGFQQAAKFSWKKTAQETIKVYEEVIGR